jgi:hypothetical protein
MKPSLTASDCLAWLGNVNKNHNKSEEDNNTMVVNAVKESVSELVQHIGKQ